RVVVEPPIAVPGSADATERLVAEALGEREAEPGVLQRRRLAGTGRPDDDVPGERVEWRTAASAAGFLQQGQRLGEALAELRDLVRACGGRSRRLALCESLGDLRVGPPFAETLAELVGPPDDDDEQDQDESGGHTDQG